MSEHQRASLDHKLNFTFAPNKGSLLEDPAFCPSAFEGYDHVEPVPQAKDDAALDKALSHIFCCLYNTKPLDQYWS